MLSRQARLSSYNALVAIAMSILSGCQGYDPAKAPSTIESFDGKLATDWIDLQLTYSKESPGFSAPVVARAFAYSGLAFYESVVNGIPNGKSLAGQLAGFNNLPAPESDKEYHWALCANAAAARITYQLYENAPANLLPKIDSLEQVYVGKFSTVPLDVAARSISFGREIADSVYSYSKTDGGHKAFNKNFPASYVPPAGPGLWVPTNSQLALLPYWGSNRTFVPNLNTLVTTAGHPAYDTNSGSDFYNEANTVYTTANTITAEQQTIAYYWADESFVTFTPAGHSMCMFSQLAAAQDFNLREAALGYVRMGLAMSDAFVYCWKTKFADNLLRPSQFIQASIDAFWIPLIPNPPFPEYTSGHSTESAASARVLTAIFGENFAFTDLSHTRLNLGLAPRSFKNFYEMAEEAGISRIYAGIHYPNSNVQGRLSGYAIADKVLALSYSR